MACIHILPDAVANKIAAGEVIERPASVVKELLENALDAGAERIRAEAQAGGKRRIQVVDDGCGMVRDDAMLAFERHATSKLRSAGDLLSIATLGFRGEALPAMAAVSRLVLETRSREEAAGTRVEMAGGRMLNVQEAGLPTGTAVTVSDLFYNIPARRKFLRSETTELSHITSLVTHYALAFPEKAFLLTTPTGDLVNVSPAGSVRERVFQLFGGELLEQLVEFGPRRAPVLAAAEGEEAGDGESATEPQAVTLTGFLSRPQVQKLGRNWVYIFVNRRLIRDRVLLHAIQEAYRNILPAHCFPVVLLFLDVPYEEVDVNVHPSKIEVRFRNQTFIHDLVRDALRECLTTSKPISTFPAGASWAPEAGAGKAAAQPGAAGSSAAMPDPFLLSEPRLPAQPQAFRWEERGTHANFGAAAGAFSRGTDCGAGLLDAGADAGADGAAGDSEEVSADRAGAELAELRPLGQIQESFIVAASGSGLWLIDQHVAHERVLFERFLAQRENGSVESQRLLMPYVLRLTAAQRIVWEQIGGELEAAGFEAEPFGQNTVAIKAAPAGVKAEDVEKLLSELVESLEKESRTFSPEALRNKIAASVACHAAIKVNMPLEPRKMEWLLRELAATRAPMSCPHGRPVVLKYGMREILKAFHRI